MSRSDLDQNGACDLAFPQIDKLQRNHAVHGSISRRLNPVGPFIVRDESKRSIAEYPLSGDSRANGRQSFGKAYFETKNPHPTQSAGHGLKQS
jgi:hypothetical protein